VGAPEPVPEAPAQGSRVRVRPIERFDGLEALAGEWNALAERAQTSTIFQTYEFHASWWTACAANARPRVLVAEADGRVLGIAPLVLVEASLFGTKRRVLQFIGARSFDYTDFIAPADRGDVLAALVAATIAQSDYDVLYLRDIPSESPSIGMLETLAGEHRRAIDVRTLYPAPTRIFNDAAADRQLPQKKSLKRHYNALRKRGRVEFRNCQAAAEVAGYLETFFEQHVARRDATQSPSVFVDPAQRELFRELVRRIAPRSWLLFSVLLLDDKPVAMHFGFEYGGRLTWYKPSFDLAYARESPGEVLIKYLLEYALERKVRELDFTIGEEAFKYRFANHTRYNCAVRVYRRGFERYVDRFVLSLRGALERHPALERTARKVLWRLRDRAWM
jgi:CelD/BcsL family acetyltransferase involved in cellulose biosynthesis